MKKQYFISILLCVYSCSAFAGEAIPQSEQTNLNPQTVETSVNDGDDKQTDTIVPEPKKPGILDTWGKVITLKWRSLSRDDAWNIGKTVTLAGIGYYLFSWVKPTGPSGPSNGNPPIPPQPNQGRAARNQTFRQMQEQLRQQQELLQRLQQQEEDDFAEAIRQSQEMANQRNNNASVVNNPVVDDQAPQVAHMQKDCDICFDTKNISEFTIMPCCQYSSCTACLMDHLSRHFDETSTENLKCPNRGCDRKIEQPVMKAITVTNKAIYNRYNEVALKEFLAKDTTLKQCPTPDCPNQFEPDRNRKQTYTCEACNQKYCSHCLIHHDLVRVSCDQARRDKELATNPDIANQATQEWIAANTKPCPQCQTRVQKNMGCNHMTCRQCKHQFCWTCLGRYGNGGCSSSRCATQNVHTGYDF